MSKKIFTAEEVKALSENPYVASISKRTMILTPEFKQLAFDELTRGKSIRQVFECMGFDPNVVGETRMHGYRERILREGEREEGFQDLRKNNHRHEAQSTQAQMAKRIRQLEHQVAYLEQENEFIKKIQQLEKDFDGKAGKRN